MKRRKKNAIFCGKRLRLLSGDSQCVRLYNFVLIYTLVLRGLWKQRRQWYAVGLWASGVGLVLVGIVLPVWADDTVSIVWWGLAAVVCSKNYKGEIYGTSHKKTT